MGEHRDRPPLVPYPPSCRVNFQTAIVLDRDAGCEGFVVCD